MAEKMSKAPVYLVVAQIKFNKFNALDTYIPTIQDEFRKSGYPDFQKSIINVLNMQMGGGVAPMGALGPAIEAMSRYTFLNIMRDEGFILNQDSLTYLVSEYEVFDIFVKRFMKGLDILHSLLNLAYTERLGLRYLDAVCPNEGEDIAKYLRGTSLGLEKSLDGGLVHSFSETVFKSGSVVITARTVVQRGRVGLPVDLHPPVVPIPSRFATWDGLHAILDTDASLESRLAFSSQAVDGQIRDAHREVSKVFASATTDYAREEAWK